MGRVIDALVMVICHLVACTKSHWAARSLKHSSSRPRAQAIVRSLPRWPSFGCYRHWQRIRSLGIGLCQSFRMRPGRSAWRGCSSNWVSTQPRAKNTSLMTSIRYCLITRIKQARFSRRESTSRVRFRPGSPARRLMRTTINH